MKKRTPVEKGESRMANITINLDTSYFNAPYLPMLNNTERFNVCWGGAGSGKSHFVVQKIILKALKHDNRTILFVRKVQATIKDSIFQLAVDELTKMGIVHLCEISYHNLTIKFPNGSRIIAKGLDDSEKIKSIAGIDDIVIEEATEISQDDFSQLNLRLRSKAKNQQIHLMFNPVSKLNWVYNHFFERGTPKNTLILHTTYKDNRFLPKEYIASLESYKITNPLYYQIYVLGGWGITGKRVFDNWKVEQFDKETLLKNPAIRAVFGMDFGYINDPTTFVSSLVDMENKKLYIFSELYEHGLTNDRIAQRIYEMGYSKEIITADSAEQKSIDEIRNLGIRKIRPTKKGAGSINQGIQFLQQFEIIVHPSCQNVALELESYSYRKDKTTGLYTNTPVDAYNHCIDALRYSVTDFSLKKPVKVSKGTFGL